MRKRIIVFGFISLGIFLIGKGVLALSVALPPPSFFQSVPSLLPEWNAGKTYPSSFQTFKETSSEYPLTVSTQQIKDTYKLDASIEFICNNDRGCPPQIAVKNNTLSIGGDVTSSVRMCGNQKLNKIFFSFNANENNAINYCWNLLSSQNLISCVETDDGVDYYKKENVIGRIESGGNPIQTDRCETSTRLREYFCDKDNNISQQIYSCPFRCEDGRCVEFSNQEQVDLSLEEIYFDPQERDLNLPGIYYDFYQIPQQKKNIPHPNAAIYYRLKNYGDYYKGIIATTLQVNGEKAIGVLEDSIELYPNEEVVLHYKHPGTTFWQLGNNTVQIKIESKIPIEELNKENNLKNLDVYIPENVDFPEFYRPKQDLQKLFLGSNSILIPVVLGFAACIILIFVIFRFYKRRK